MGVTVSSAAPQGRDSDQEHAGAGPEGRGVGGAERRAAGDAGPRAEGARDGPPLSKQQRFSGCSGVVKAAPPAGVPLPPHLACSAFGRL